MKQNNIEKLRPVDGVALGKLKARINGFIEEEKALLNSSEISPEEHGMRLKRVKDRLLKYGEELGLPEKRIKEELKVLDELVPIKKETFIYSVEDQIKVAKERAIKWVENHGAEKNEGYIEERAQILESAYQNKRTPEEAQEILRTFDVWFELSKEKLEEDDAGKADGAVA